MLCIFIDRSKFLQLVIRFINLQGYFQDIFLWITDKTTKKKLPKT